LWNQQKAAYGIKQEHSTGTEEEAPSFEMYRDIGDDEPCLSDDPLAEAARLAEAEYLGDTGGDDLLE
jgi:hypothetical protein